MKWMYMISLINEFKINDWKNKWTKEWRLKKNQWMKDYNDRMMQWKKEVDETKTWTDKRPKKCLMN